MLIRRNIHPRRTAIWLIRLLLATWTSAAAAQKRIALTFDAATCAFVASPGLDSGDGRTTAADQEAAMKTSWRTISIVLGLAWAASLALPVATFGDGHGELWYGWSVLLLGWLGFFLGQFAWIANFLFATALILLVRGRPPLVWGLMIGVLTSAVAAHSLSWTSIYETGGGIAPVLAYWSGYYLWVLVTFAGGVALCFASVREVRQPAALQRTT